MTNLIQYIKTEHVIDGIKTVNDLEGACFAFWKFRRKMPCYSDMSRLFRKDNLRERLLEKMREVL